MDLEKLIALVDKGVLFRRQWFLKERAQRPPAILGAKFEEAILRHRRADMLVMAQKARSQLASILPVRSRVGPGRNGHL